MATRRLGIPRRFTFILLGLTIVGLLASPSDFTAQTVAAEKFSPPLSWLVAQVLGASGQPLDAIVVVQGTVNLTGRTDARGHYRAKVPAGTYAVTAMYASASVTRRVIVRAGRTSSISLALNVSVASAVLRQPAATSPASAASQAGAVETTRTPQGSYSPAPGGGGSQSSPDASGTTTSGALLGKSSKPPRVKALKADPGVTEPNGTSKLTAVIENPSNAALTYRWAASGGIVSGHSTSATWTAPASPGSYTVTLTVTDSKKRSASASVSVQAVEPDAAEAPSEPAPESSPAPSGSRDPAVWPFDTGSPWNYPIGSGAAYSRIDSPSWTVSGGGAANIEVYSIPTYVATASDPLRSVFDRKAGKVVATIRVPDTAVPAVGTDAHLNVIDETHQWVSELYSAQRLANGDLSTYGYIRNDLRGLGGGFSSWHGSVAAGTSGLGGMIRKGELASGTAGLSTGIRHALQGIVYPRALNRYAPGGRRFVWPASSADTNGDYETLGNVYMGSLLAIPSWVDIKSLGITDPQALEIARVLQDYGVYIVDTGGIPSDKIVIRIDPQASRDIKSRSAFDAGLSLALKQLWIVSNSHANGYRPTVPGGGGIPRRPLAPALISSAIRDDQSPLADETPRGIALITLVVSTWISGRSVHRRH